MKVIKHWQVKHKKGVAVPFLRSLYDMRAEIMKVADLITSEYGAKVPDGTIDFRPQLMDWCDKLNSLTIKDAIKEINYASQERLQITRGKEVKSGEGKKEEEITKQTD